MLDSSRCRLVTRVIDSHFTGYAQRLAITLLATSPVISRGTGRCQHRQRTQH